MPSELHSCHHQRGLAIDIIYVLHRSVCCVVSPSGLELEKHGRRCAGGGDCLAKLSQDPEVEGLSAAYFNNQTTDTVILSPGHEFRQKEPSEEARDEAEATKLWELSSKLVGLDA